MVRKSSIKKAIHAAIISAFSIATALIWRDVIIESIDLIFQPQDAIIWKFLIAIIATVILIVVLSIVLKTEEDVEFVMKKLKGGTVKFVKAPDKKQAQQPEKKSK